MTNEEEEYVTLFCEGDGHVRITDSGYPKIAFGQKERNVLDYIDSLTVGGHVYSNGPNAWSLEFCGSYCIPLLEIFSRHVVGRQFLDGLNKVLEHVDMSLAAQHSLTLDGFVGFWDAEGSSGNMPKVTISQKYREVLNLIAEMLGGSVTRYKELSEKWQYQWELYGEKARKLYRIILEKSHCPIKAKEMRENFEGPSYYELNKDKAKTYYERHKAEYKTRSKEHNTERKATQEWMRIHPEVVKRLKCEL